MMQSELDKLFGPIQDLNSLRFEKGDEYVSLKFEGDVEYDIHARLYGIDWNLKRIASLLGRPFILHTTVVSRLYDVKKIEAQSDSRILQARTAYHYVSANSAVEIWMSDKHSLCYSYHIDNDYARVCLEAYRKVLGEYHVLSPDEFRRARTEAVNLALDDLINLHADRLAVEEFQLAQMEQRGFPLEAIEGRKTRVKELEEAVEFLSGKRDALAAS